MLEKFQKYIYYRAHRQAGKLGAQLKEDLIADTILWVLEREHAIKHGLLVRGHKPRPITKDAIKDKMKDIQTTLMGTITTRVNGNLQRVETRPHYDDTDQPGDTGNRHIKAKQGMKALEEQAK